MPVAIRQIKPFRRPAALGGRMPSTRACQVCAKVRRDRCVCAEGTPGSLREKPVNPLQQTKKRKASPTATAHAQPAEKKQAAGGHDSEPPVEEKRGDKPGDKDEEKPHDGNPGDKGEEKVYGGKPGDKGEGEKAGDGGEANYPSGVHKPGELLQETPAETALGLQVAEWVAYHEWEPATTRTGKAVLMSKYTGECRWSRPTPAERDDQRNFERLLARVKAAVDLGRQDVAEKLARRAGRALPQAWAEAATFEAAEKRRANDTMKRRTQLLAGARA